MKKITSGILAVIMLLVSLVNIVAVSPVYASTDYKVEWTEDEFRSINGQLQWIISEALRKNGRLKKRKMQEVEEDKLDENAEDSST